MKEVCFINKGESIEKLKKQKTNRKRRCFKHSFTSKRIFCWYRSGNRNFTRYLSFWNHNFCFTNGWRWQKNCRWILIHFINSCYYWCIYPRSKRFRRCISNCWNFAFGYWMFGCFCSWNFLSKILDETYQQRQTWILCFLFDSSWNSRTNLPIID